MTVEIQIEVQETKDLPGIGEFIHWGQTTLNSVSCMNSNLTIKIVEIQEMIRLNSYFRGKYTATNVLSFPFQEILDIHYDYLGDIVLCAAVLREQAKNQGKTIQAHCVHLIIHSVLHLCGFDHISDINAEKMEKIETNIIVSLGFKNPYDI